MASIAAKLGAVWDRKVTSYAVAIYSVLEQDPLPLSQTESAKNGGRNTASASLDEVLSWACRQSVSRPGLLTFSHERGPMADRHVSVREMRDTAKRLSVSLASKPAETSAREKPLSGLREIHEYVTQIRPCSMSALEKWIGRSVDPMPVSRYGSGSRMTANKTEIAAWVAKQKAKADEMRRVKRLARSAKEEL